MSDAWSLENSKKIQEEEEQQELERQELDPYRWLEVQKREAARVQEEVKPFADGMAAGPFQFGQSDWAAVAAKTFTDPEDRRILQREIARVAQEEERQQQPWDEPGMLGKTVQTVGEAPGVGACWTARMYPETRDELIHAGMDRDAEKARHRYAFGEAELQRKLRQICSQSEQFAKGHDDRFPDEEAPGTADNEVATSGLTPEQRRRLEELDRESEWYAQQRRNPYVERLEREADPDYYQLMRLRRAERAKAARETLEKNRRESVKRLQEARSKMLRDQYLRMLSPDDRYDFEKEERKWQRDETRERWDREQDTLSHQRELERNKQARKGIIKRAPAEAVKRNAGQGGRRTATLPIYATKIDEDEDDVLVLANGGIIKVTYGYLGYVGYNRDAILFKDASTWKIWIERKRVFKCDVLRFPSVPASGSAERVCISEVKGDGKILVMMSKALYEVDDICTIETALWLGVSDALLIDGTRLINFDEASEIVGVTRLK